MKTKITITSPQVIGDGSLAKTSCPFLGLKQDAATAMGYADAANQCHVFKKMAAVPLHAQSELCLSEAYRTCRRYQLRMASEEARANSAGKARGWFGRFVVLLPLIMIFAAAFVWWPEPGQSVEDFTAYARSLSNQVWSQKPGESDMSQKIEATKGGSEFSLGQNADTTDLSEREAGMFPEEDSLAAPARMNNQQPVLADKLLQQAHRYRVLIYE